MPEPKKRECRVLDARDLVSVKNPFFHLIEPEIQELLKVGTVHRFARGASLFCAGDLAGGIFCLLEGAVKISQLHRGKAFTVRFAAKGDWVGHRSIFTRATYLGSATAREPTSACYVPASLLLKFFGANTAFAAHMLRQISSDLEASEKKFIEYKELNVPSRLISLFRALDQKFGAKSGEVRKIQLRLSKLEISEMIGASHEVVVRQLSKWKREKLIWEDGKRYALSPQLLERVILTDSKTPSHNS